MNSNYNNTNWIKYPHLLTLSWDKNKIVEWLKEDIPSFDYSGFVVGSKEEEAILYCKSNGIICGFPFVESIFEILGCTVEWKMKEGTFIEISNNRIEIAKIKGPCANLLIGERTALNLMARASGIATNAYLSKQQVIQSNWKGKIAGTRKTTPGFRIVEKYALLVGGCDTHRMDLSSMIMLKDNHIWSCGNITNAIQKARNIGGFSLKIEIECQSLEEAQESINAGADIIMLDNFLPNKLKEVAKILKEKNPNILIEASGGITLENLSQYFDPNIDIISMGNLTQEILHVDFSLKINKNLL